MNTEIVLSIVVASATVCYTGINWLMWKESRATRKQRTLPHIISYLKYTESKEILCLHIKNIGEGCAKNVTIQTIVDYNRYGKSTHPLSACKVIKNGLNVFPSQEKIKIGLNYASFSNLDQEGVEIEIHYCDQNNKQQASQRYVLPFNQVTNHSFTPPTTHLGQIAYYLKKLQETLSTKTQA